MPVRPTLKDILPTILLVISIVILDQFTKALAIAYLKPLHSVPVVGEFLRLTYVENSGMAFGIEINNKLYFHTLSVIAVLIIFYYLLNLRNHVLLRTSFAVILGGAFGNLIDRLSRGSVVDFLDVEFFDIRFPGASFWFWSLPPYSMDRWPVFNIADMAVSVGMMIIAIAVFLDDSPKVVFDNAAQEEA